MSISGAMANALTGLTAVSRGIEVTSSNIANARTPGYARRELSISTKTLGGDGGGVQVDGVMRRLDKAVLADLRLADATVSAGATRLDFRDRFAGMIGQPGEDGSISDRIARLESALVEASNRPDSTTRLNAVVSAAGDIAGRLNQATDLIQTARLDADKQIATTVTAINQDLNRVHELNGEIRRITTLGGDSSSLMDQRQQLIDGLAEQIPLRELSRQDGAVALVTPGGAVLLDGKPKELGFSPVGTIVPEMTVASALSGLTLDGKPMPLSGGEGKLGGGRLGALFDVRDSHTVEAQGMVDALARDLYERFADPALDSTLFAGESGLFTDAGGAFDPTGEVGFAGRIAVNARVDPAQGGELWRLRAGIDATAPNNAGDGSLLAGMADALAASRSPASGPFGPSAQSAGSLAGDAASIWAGGTGALEAAQSYATARADSLRQMHLADGVDTDHEMQNLLVLEQSYAANAKIIATLDELLQNLLRI